MEENYDELAFVNDSCYGPLYPLKPIIEQVGECDFWGMTRNLEWREHIQSFFIVFKKQVFTSEIFKNFMASIKDEEKKLDVVTKYEIGLSRLLLENGFNFDDAALYCATELMATYSNLTEVKKGSGITTDIDGIYNKYQKDMGNVRVEYYNLNREYNLSLIHI